MPLLPPNLAFIASTASLTRTCLIGDLRLLSEYCVWLYVARHIVYKDAPYL